MAKSSAVMQPVFYWMRTTLKKDIIVTVSLLKFHSTEDNKTHTNTNSTKQKLFKGKPKFENSKWKKMKHIKLWRSKEKHKHLKEWKRQWSYLKLLAICSCAQISLLPSSGHRGLLEICTVQHSCCNWFPTYLCFVIKYDSCSITMLLFVLFMKIA